MQNVQSAVDLYAEVILKGEFNFGTAYISISKDTHLRGSGRENGVPQTKVRKQGWNFPFTNYDKLIDVRGKDIQVTIENIHFMDFNNTCILAMEGHDITVVDNWFTLYSPVGRGMRYNKWGNQISAMVLSGDVETGGFKGKTVVKGNHIDFGLELLQSNRIAMNGNEYNPFYRPDMEKPESYVSYGIIVNRKLGKVVIEDNVIKNVNFTAIFCMDNHDTAEVSIVGNKIDLDVFGPYFANSVYAGYGISAKSYWQHFESLGGFNLIIKDNEIRCRKVNFCGISVTGPARGHDQMKGLKKLVQGEVKNNKVQLDDGAVGILVDRCDDFLIKTQWNGNLFIVYLPAQIAQIKPTTLLPHCTCMNEMDKIVRVDLLNLDLYFLHIYRGQSNVQIASSGKIDAVAYKADARLQVLHDDSGGEITLEL